MANSVYENNANVDLTRVPQQHLDECDYTPADGAFDTLLYLSKNKSENLSESVVSD